MTGATILHLLFTTGFLGLTVALFSARKRWLAASTLVLGTAWLLYYRSILKWVSYLGSDSFSEAQHFDLAEALTFLETTTQVLQREGLGIIAATLLAGSLAVFSIHMVGRRLRRGRWNPGSTPFMTSALVLVAGAWLSQVYPAFGAFRWNSQYYQGIYDNFHAHTDVRLAAETPLTDLNVIVHIGESTTSMNMGIYGYMRPTTPELEAFAADNDNLLVFHDVLSTHTHTAPSLLEALSIGADPAEDFLPISERKRTAIIDLLKQAGISTALISNQGQTGSWNNLASTVVFRNVDEKEFSFDSTWMGEMEHFASRPLDHEFLLPALERSGQLERPGPSVLFLHSYAGHSPYWRHIAPEFREPVDDLLAGLPEIAIVGEGITNRQHTIRRLEQYDAVIRYVDQLVATVLRRVQASPHPVVYIYFSDHGEAIYAGLGHDSSRFLHEMARIPFLVYFNDAAAQSYPGIVEQFRGAARAQRVSTLAQFPASLLSLFGLSVDGDGLQGIGLEELDSLPPILTRETAAGFRYIPLGANEPAPPHVEGLTELRDPHTLVFRASRQHRGRPPSLCIQRAHSVGKAVRGSTISDCLHAEISLGPEGQPTTTAPAKLGSTLPLDIFLTITSSYNINFLFDINFVPGAVECAALVDALGNRQRNGPPDGLLMFPAELLDAEVVHQCIRPLEALGFDIGIKLPAELAQACLESTGNGPLAAGPCERLRGFMMEAEGRAGLSDIGIDASQVGLVEWLGRDRSFHWTVLGVPIDELDTLVDWPVRHLVVESSYDPNEP
jgi:glucan phosphoethanolaminetransferase (alkaline phosphatase superfamily)